MKPSLILATLCLVVAPLFASASSVMSLKKSKARATNRTPAAESVATSSTSMTNKTMTPNFEPKGFRFSFFKPVLRMNVQAHNRGNTEYTFDHTFGLSAGYAHLPLKEFGWTANVSYLEIFYAGEKIGLARTDANLGYGFTKNLNVKGGLNLSKFIVPDRIRDEYNPAIGLQGSLGVQVTKNVGIDAGYSYMKQTNTRETVELAGMELGLNATF